MKQRGALVQIHTDLGTIIRAYRKFSFLNGMYHQNKPLCESMHKVALSINERAKDLSSGSVHIDTERIWIPNTVVFQGTNMVQKWKMAPFME